MKKAYSTPELTVHGDIEKITLSGVLMNADTPMGDPNTADCDNINPLCVS